MKKDIAYILASMNFAPAIKLLKELGFEAFKLTDTLYHVYTKSDFKFKDLIKKLSKKVKISDNVFEYKNVDYKLVERKDGKVLLTSLPEVFSDYDSARWEWPRMDDYG